ncbi:MAG TPA: class I SAM-dependent methyltransferase [Arcobacter sp.]|nr:class I SAM-dependent methyltransferase [Arcobacter sp.]
MNSISKIKGLKYPDEYFTKFFFKNKLHEKKRLKYLEFGCGNGSNLMLPYGYENSAIGVDYSSGLIEMASHNFALLNNQGSNYEFIAEDMREFVKIDRDIYADVFLLPSVIYYITQKDFEVFLKNIIQNRYIKESIPFYIRVRTQKDFRFGLGKKIASNSYQMPEDVITGESNALITFYDETIIVKLLEKYLKLRDYKIFNLDNQNEHNGEIVLNSDIVIWGTIN